MQHSNRIMFLIELPCVLFSGDASEDAYGESDYGSYDYSYAYVDFDAELEASAANQPVDLSTCQLCDSRNK